MDELDIYGGYGNTPGLGSLDLGADFSAESLQDFMRLKSSPVLTDRIRAFREFGPDALGKDTWVIGLVGMMYDKETPLSLSRQIMMSMLDFVGQDPLFLSVSILKVLNAQLEEMKPLAKIVKTTLLSQRFIAHLRHHRKERLGKELQHLSLRVLEGFGFSEECDRLLKDIGADPLARVRSKPTSNSYKAAPSVAAMDDARVDRSKSVALDRVYSKTSSMGSSLKLLSSLDMTLSLFNKSAVEKMAANHALLLGALSVASKYEGIRTISVDSLPPSQVAIVTDFPVTNTFEANNVAVLKVDPLHRVKVFSDYFESVLLKRYEYVVVVFPHSKGWSSRFFAQEAVSKLGVESRVKLLDSLIYGPGFQLFFDFVVAYLNEGNSISFLETKMVQWKETIYSLVALENSTSIQQWPWFDAIRPSKNSFVMSCAGDMQLKFSSNNIQESIAYMFKTVSVTFPPTFEGKIMIMYYQLEDKAHSLQEELMQYFRKADIQCIQAHYVFAAHYGPFVGVAYCVN